MVHAVILAAGKGERMGLDIPKQLIKIAGKTVLEHTLDVFEKCRVVDDITLVASMETKVMIEETIVPKYKKLKKVVIGGRTRRESSYIGIRSLEASEDDIVLIHDAVRPFVDCEMIERMVRAAEKFGAADTVIETPDTIVRVNRRGFVSRIPLRKFLRRGQTPQAFKYSVILKAHEMAKKSKNIDRYVTDDCGLVLRFGISPVKAEKGSEWNIKITYPLDIHIADKIFQIRSLEILPRCHGIEEKISGKVMAIFGGSRGIGREIAEIARKMGAKVHTFSRSNGVDVRNLKDVERALKNVYRSEGRIDHIVNTAGVLRYGPLVNRNYDDIISEIETNYIGSINVILAGYEYLSETSGMILLFSSSSYTRGRKYYSVYSSTKSAVVNLAQALSEEFSNVRINVIVPERTATPMRFENFGLEPPETLLDPRTVALVSLEVLTMRTTGGIFEVKKIQEREIMDRCGEWYR